MNAILEAPDDLVRLKSASAWLSKSHVAPLVDAREAVQHARAMLTAKIEPAAQPYPTESLGSLADACSAIAEHGQVRPAMAGQCLLGAASLLTQGLFNVETLNGTRPLSLNLLTLGDSGDGKSTAQSVALSTVNEWQRKEAVKYTEALKDFETAKAKRKPNDDPPAAPASPYRLCADATVEGLRRDLDTGPCSQGVFTDEAASMLSGYGMSPDHRSKTAGVFSRLWDSGHLSVSRAGGPRVERYGRRIALHWLIQPMAASETISDPMLTQLGFWPRFLTARPEPQLPRLARPFEPGKVASIGTYWRRCSELLARSLPDDATDNAVIRLSDDARAALSAAFERFERAARGGDLQVIKPFALRAAEQACRIAGVLAAFDDQQVVSRELMLSALNLTTYSLDTWHELINQGAADTGSTVALRLYEWLVQRPSWRERLAVIVKDGPTCVRSKDRRDAAIDLLMEFGLLEIVGGQAQALVPAPEEAT